MTKTKTGRSKGMGRPKLESSIKMQDARNIEALVTSSLKACTKIVKNNQEIERKLFDLATNKNARQAFLNANGMKMSGIKRRRG